MSQSDTDGVADLLSRWAAARASGRPVDPADLCRDRPGLLPHVQAAVAAAERLGQLAGSAPGDPATTAAAAPASDPPSEPLPAAVGPYTVSRLLGQGGMGRVFAARDPALRREVAVKVLHAHTAARPEARERFLREARAAAALQHDHVVPVYHVGEDAGTPFLVMPLLAGETLQDRLARLGPRPPAEVAALGRQAAGGLAAAHANGLVHRDVKPSNLWVEETPAGPRVRVLDFGVAWSAAEAGDRLTMSGAAVGTPCYMAPEQADGLPVDHRADLFALGAVLYEAATGVSPFRRPTLAAVVRALAEHHPPPPREVNPGVPAALSALIVRLLAKEPAGRPATAADAEAELAAVERRATGAASPDPMTTLPQETVPAVPHRRRRVWWAVPAAAAVLAAGFAACPGPTGVGCAGPAGPGGAAADQADRTAAEPLRVVGIEVEHFRTVPGGAVPRGVLGRESFHPAVGDRVRVRAALSRPAYAFLIACRPDGVVEVCYPAAEGSPPPLADRPQYPPADARDEFYRLEEGAGLWVFAVVASDAPLPAWTDWAGRAVPWRPERPPGGTVWQDDGAWPEVIGPDGSSRGDRGKGDKVPGMGAVRRVTDWLKRHGAASAVGFVAGRAGD